MSHAAIIGGGHNGLAAAIVLARGGMKVTVFEARDRVGGLCAREEFADGYAVPGILHDSRTLRPGLVDVLGLSRHGLRRRKAPRICAPRREGEAIWIDGAEVEGADDDRGKLRAFREFVARVKPVLADVMDKSPPDPTGAVWPLLMTGLKLRRLGKDDMLELVRVSAMCVGDWMRDSFATERLSAAMALPALEAAFMGPWSAGSAALLLLREATSDQPVEGGPAALVAALEKAAASAGVEIRTDTRVEKIALRGGKATGVIAGGEEIAAEVVLSTVDPKQTFRRLLDPYRVPDSVSVDIRNLRARGTIAKLHLGLSAPLSVDGVDVELMRTGETLDDIERAFDSLKYGGFAERPALEVWQPSLDDASLCPSGHAVASLMVHFASYDLRGGWDDEKRAALSDAAIAELERYLPDVKERIVARELLTPVDIEDRYGTTGGHLHHGEHAPDQLLFMRPTVECGRYATPIEGLWLGSSGSHPGGGVTCAPGALAARAILG